MSFNYFVGIWIRDIRYKCNLLLTQVNKILRNLESKKLIKAVKSVAVSQYFFALPQTKGNDFFNI